MSRKGKFYSLSPSKKNIDQVYEHVLKIWNKFEMKKMKDYHDLKCNVLLFADVFKKLRNDSFKN